MVNPYLNDDLLNSKWFKPKKPRRKRIKDPSACPSEYSEQVQFVKFLKEKGYKYSAIPMSTWTSYSQQMKNKSSGVCPGVPDMLIIVNDRLVWIEMKRIDKKPKRGGMGGLSPAQREWIDVLNNCKGCEAHVTYGCEEAKEIIMGIDKM